MNFVNSNATKTTCWQKYKELELISDTVPAPQASIKFAFGLKQAWRLLLVALTQELVYEQQVEYLQRCWTENEIEQNQEADPNTLQKLWILMN